MSRSNPTDNSPNPTTRWFEWDGGNGGVRYYDKEAKKNVEVGDFTFILLDEMSTVKGWHDPSDSGIYSNEVRDTKQETLLVKSFKGGVLGEGLYAQIRDRITAIGGKYSSSCYIAYKDDTGKLALGNIQLNGAVLNLWVDFKKASPSSMVNGKSVKDLYTKAIRISGKVAKKKGRVDFVVPEKFAFVPISPQANAEANELDKQLQSFLTAYLSRTKVEQAHPPIDDATKNAHQAFDNDQIDHVAVEQEAARQAAKRAERVPAEEEFVDDEIPF